MTVAHAPRPSAQAEAADDLLTGVPIRSRLRRLSRILDRTPGKLRAARMLVVLILLATFAAGVYAAQGRVHVVEEIQTRSEPLSADAIEVYRRLADADATVAREFLPGGERDVAAARNQYDIDFEAAATSLAHAGTLAGKESIRTRRIADIAYQVVLYSRLVERARTKRELGQSPAEELRQASDLMRSTILRLAETLQRTESDNLEAQYREAQSLPGLALIAGLIGLGTLVLLQLYLFRTFHRLVNVGLVLATVAVIATAAWWTGALAISSSRLESARRHSQAVTDALGEAQIAARQARASELLALQPEPVGSEQDFLDKAQVLVRAEGNEFGGGGALGAAQQYARGQEERGPVDKAVEVTGRWLRAHQNAVTIRKEIPGPAGAAAASPSQREATAAFGELDAILTEAIAKQDGAFRRDIGRSRDALFGFVVGTGLLTLASAGLAARGVTARLEEYR